MEPSSNPICEDMLRGAHAAAIEITFTYFEPLLQIPG